jgi:hypothetical protein
MLKKLTERQRRGRCTFGHSRRGTRTFKSTAPPSGVCSLGGAACALAPEILQRRFVCHGGVKVQLTRNFSWTSAARDQVRFPDGRPSKYLHWDDLPSRQLRPDLITSEVALEQAKALVGGERRSACPACRPGASCGSQSLAACLPARSAESWNLGAVLRAAWNNASSNRLPDEGFNHAGRVGLRCRIFESDL